MAKSGFNPFNLITAGLILYLIYILIFSGISFASFFVEIPDPLWVLIVLGIIYWFLKK